MTLPSLLSQRNIEWFLKDMGKREPTSQSKLCFLFEDILKFHINVLYSYLQYCFLPNTTATEKSRQTKWNLLYL